MKETKYFRLSNYFKLIVIINIIATSQLFSQTYLGISYNNGDPANSTSLSLLQKITFSGSDITFLLTDNSSVTKALSTIDLMGFSGTDGGNPLPVELVSFTATVNGNDINLEWITATEVDNYGFEIERKTNNDWEKIGFIEGHGNSNSPKVYTFTDVPVSVMKLNYRLKQIDTDGSFEYSKVVNVSLSIPTEYELKQNYPNPFNPATKITYSLPKDGLITLKVYDVLGEEVASLVYEDKKAGNYTVRFDGTQLSSGVYFSRLTAGNYTGIIKMLLVK